MRSTLIFIGTLLLILLVGFTLALTIPDSYTTLVKVDNYGDIIRLRIGYNGVRLISIRDTILGSSIKEATFEIRRNFNNVFWHTSSVVEGSLTNLSIFYYSFSKQGE